MCIKGHNGFCPCRACDIQGVRNAAIRNAPYYVPLFHPLDDPREDVDPASYWDPENLPLRPETGDHSWDNRIASILDGQTKKERDRRARILGINGKSIMSTIPGIVMTRSFPYEGMHLFFENLIPNMINHWKGEFKTLDSGSQDYIIEPSVWETIGLETEAAVRTIPSAFVGKLPDIHTSQYLYKAEYYSFWFIYLAPILLHGRFKQNKYYQHASDLSKILKKCLEIEITRTEIDQLKKDMIQWVVTYEE
ncbi:hypothetical protein M407DRAFT_15835 [Tulasnella calospora MUT 4182]|uniref:Uncharacterized protein n=1 Tax=Tulasnella calospora MUT 4182 TaxID=1051891 RepID=A0A0C3KIR3_9AGAM|nr:hypothetical protein M407DRAFT_15835 [Tulasnella calospora MUT 4182]